MGSGELPTSYCSHPLSLIDQDYRARKRQRLQKRLSEQMRSAWQQGAASAGLALGTGSDLMQIINSFTGSLPPFLPSSPAPLLPSLPPLPPFLPSSLPSSLSSFWLFSLFLHVLQRSLQVTLAQAVAFNMQKNFNLARWVGQSTGGGGGS